MTNELHEEIGRAGMIKKVDKKVDAVINIVTTDEELERYLNLVLESINQVFERLDEGNSIINL